MKLPTRLGVALAGALLVASCGGGSSAAEGSEPATVEPEPAVTVNEATPEPPTPEPEAPTSEPEAPEPVALTDDEMIAATRAAFAAEPGELIAWDELEAVAFGDRVRLSVCGWTGETVYDAVRTVEYEVAENEQGELAAGFLFDGNTPDDCVNQELIQSALAFTNDYTVYWDSVRSAPETFAPAKASELMTVEALTVSQDLASTLAASGVHWEGHEFDLTANTVNEVLMRRYERDDEPIVEILACVDIDPGFGQYRSDGSLVDDFKGDATGQHVIRRFELVRSESGWLFDGSVETAWANCIDNEQPWLDVINDWKPDPVPWQVVPNA